MEPLSWPLVWVDLEMTGLDPDTDRILEIAVIVTDGELERIVEGPDLVVNCPETALERKLPKLEQERDDLTASLQVLGDDFEAVRKAGERLTAVMAEIDEVETRWLELSEIRERASSWTR